jgi:hypothetical protein
MKRPQPGRPALPPGERLSARITLRLSKADCLVLAHLTRLHGSEAAAVRCALRSLASEPALPAEAERCAAHAARCLLALRAYNIAAAERELELAIRIAEQLPREFALRTLPLLEAISHAGLQAQARLKARRLLS